MDPEFLLRLARRARALASRVRTEAARRQLLIWAEEFEARAAAPVDQEPGKKPS